MTATGYVRQSAAEITTGSIIQASSLNNEYNQLASAFDGTSGHDHSGGSGLGPKLSLTAAVTGILPAANGGTGVANSGTITIGGNLTLSGAYTFTGTLTANTAVTFPTSGTLITNTVTALNSLTSASSLATVGTLTAGVWNGTKIGLAYGGTNADLSATGGTSQILKQVTVGGNITVGTLAFSDLSVSTTGSGAVVLTSGPTITSATLITPALGTPASGVATNLTGTASGLTAGNVTTNANLTGDVTSVGNATTIGNNKVTNAMLAQMAANTIKLNNTGGTANAIDGTVAQLAVMLSAPQITVYTSGTGTYTTPSGAKYIIVEGVGAGGGGAGSGTTPGAATAGGNTTFGTLTGNGGALGSTTGTTTAGGGGSNGDVNITGGTGQQATSGNLYYGGLGGGSFFGMGGSGGPTGAGAPGNPGIQPGTGGGGAGTNATANSGGGGGGGGYFRKLITSPSGTYSYGVGAAGTAGTAGTGGAAGGAGAAGIIIVTAYFQ